MRALQREREFKERGYDPRAFRLFFSFVSFCLLFLRNLLQNYSHTTLIFSKERRRRRRRVCAPESERKEEEEERKRAGYKRHHVLLSLSLSRPSRFLKVNTRVLV
jgi:hypothetical protein